MAMTDRQAALLKRFADLERVDKMIARVRWWSGQMYISWVLVVFIAIAGLFRQFILSDAILATQLLFIVFVIGYQRFLLWRIDTILKRPCP